ncbi:MAG: M23 family metallopeptidase [Oscillospiraceae bacterium]|nr:M23 family metallopeptidase [Oscillospiraceae bacterium]
MDKRGKRQAAPIFGGMGFYIALLVCVVAAGVVGYYALLSNEDPNSETNNDLAQVVDQNDSSILTNANDAETNDDAQQVISQTPVIVTQSVSKPDIHDPVEDNSDIGEGDIPVSGEVTVPDTRPPEEEQSVPVVERIVMPLAGSTVSVFSADKLMYDATLDDWRTHDGIDICAEAGTQVVAAASGTVISVSEDDRLGVNVRIEHAGGYVTTYASLHPETLVEVGDTVSAGDVIGTVGNTSLSEAALGAHLHFSVTRNGELIDPTAYLPKEE